MALDQVDTFLAAIRRLESGSFKGKYDALGQVTNGDQALGAYQIMRSNWAGWAKEAGIAGADWRDPAAQDRVARFKMTQYYNRFGSWDLVAIAWFAGPGRAQKAREQGIGAVGGLADITGTNVSKYVQLIRGYMGEAGGGESYTPPPLTRPAEATPIPQEQDDPEASRGRLKSNLADLLASISSGIAGGTRRLPPLSRPSTSMTSEEVPDGDSQRDPSPI